MKNSTLPITICLKTYSYHKGVSLLETVLALVIVTIGLLGSLQLFSNSIKGTTGADINATASELSTQLIERMRSNNGAAAAYNLNSPASCSPALQCIQTSNSEDINCTPVEMARFDLQQISCNNSMLQSLPSGALSVSCTSTATPECNVQVSWKGSLDSVTQTISHNVIMGRAR